MIGFRAAAVALVFAGASSGAVLGQSAQSHGTITVRTDGREKVVSASDLAKLPRHEVSIDADATGTKATVSGVRLWDLLQLAGVPSPEASGRQRAVMVIKLTGADGQNAALALVEVDPSFSPRAVLIGNQRNGQPLSAAEGPWRVFIPSDVRHARWIRGLASVEVTTVK